MTETVSLEVAIEVVLRNGPTFETIAGLCKMAVEADRLTQPEQEPVAWADMDVRGEDKGLSWTPGHFHKTPLYTTPPQRPWVGLTDDEIRALASWWPSYDQMPALIVLAKDIQENLKERNNG